MTSEKVNSKRPLLPGFGLPLNYDPEQEHYLPINHVDRLLPNALSGVHLQSELAVYDSVSLRENALMSVSNL
jgi:hypothetical protein